MDDATYGTGFASFVEQLPAGSANKTTSTPSIDALVVVRTYCNWKADHGREDTIFQG